MFHAKCAAGTKTTQISAENALSLGGEKIGYWYAICNLLTIC